MRIFLRYVGRHFRFLLEVRLLGFHLISFLSHCNFYVSLSIFSHLSAETLPVDFVVRSTLFNYPLGDGPIVIHTVFFPLITKFYYALCARIFGQFHTFFPFLWRMQCFCMLYYMVTQLTCPHLSITIF